MRKSNKVKLFEDEETVFKSLHYDSRYKESFIAAFQFYVCYNYHYFSNITPSSFTPIYLKFQYVYLKAASKMAKSKDLDPTASVQSGLDLCSWLKEFYSTI